MTIAGVSNSISQSTTTSATMASYAVETQIDAGNVCVLVIASDNLAGTTGPSNDHLSVDDSQANTWEKIAEESHIAGEGAGGGATVSIWVCKLDATLTTSHTITVTFSAAITADACTGYEFTVGAGKKLALAGTVQRGGADNGPQGSLVISGLPSKEYLFVRAWGQETNSTGTPTPTASYTLFNNGTANTGTANTSMGARGEWRIQTGTGSTSAPTSIATNTDHASLFVALEEVDTGAPPPATGQSRALLGVGV